MTNKSDGNVEIDHAIYDLLTSQYTKNPELCSVRCAVAMNLAWNFTGTERLTFTMILWRNWGGWHASSVFFSLLA